MPKSATFWNLKWFHRYYSLSHSQKWGDWLYILQDFKAVGGFILGMKNFMDDLNLLWLPLIQVNWCCHRTISPHFHTTIFHKTKWIQFSFEEIQARLQHHARVGQWYRLAIGLDALARRCPRNGSPTGCRIVPPDKWNRVQTMQSVEQGQRARNLGFKMHASVRKEWNADFSKRGPHKHSQGGP